MVVVLARFFQSGSSKVSKLHVCGFYLYSLVPKTLLLRNIGSGNIACIELFQWNSIIAIYFNTSFFKASLIN